MIGRFRSRDERIRREAAGWIGRLNGPAGEADRADFARWYRESPEHAQAYDRMAALFSAAAQVPRTSAEASAARSRQRAQRPPVRFAAAAALACAVLIGGVFLGGRMTPTASLGVPSSTSIATGSGARQAVLADGSHVLLAPATALSIQFSGSERHLRLVQGEARFTVAHERRPFVVDAGGSRIVAHGTVFVVGVNGGATIVALLQGAVDVSYVAGPAAAGRRVTHMRPGERLVINRAQVVVRRAPTTQPPASTSPAMLQFDDTPLDEAIERANAGAKEKIALGNPQLGALRVTGAFRAGDTAQLARSLAAAFHLSVRRGAIGIILLERADGAPQP